MFALMSDIFMVQLISNEKLNSLNLMQYILRNKLKYYVLNVTHDIQVMDYKSTFADKSHKAQNSYY